MLSAEISVGFSETIDAVFAEASFSAEVSIGTSYSVTDSHTYNIPPNSKYLLIYGSKCLRIKGAEKYYWNGQLQQTNNVYGEWSYLSYDDMEEL